METHFIVHDKADSVGVMVVENAEAGQNLTGWIMETDETVTLKALDAVPLGHKIELMAGSGSVRYPAAGIKQPCSWEPFRAVLHGYWMVVNVRIRSRLRTCGSATRPTW